MKQASDPSGGGGDPFRHEFGGHSDLCYHCGCGRGWFSRNEGKRCDVRFEIALDIVRQKNMKARAEQREAVKMMSPVVVRVRSKPTGRRFR